MSGFQVFLSHLTVESRLADLLKQHIEEDFIGLVKVFSSTDGTSIPVGDQWLGKLIEGIESSSMHLVLCSPESIARPWIHFEAGAACIRKLRMVPLCHSGLSPTQLPVPLGLSQGVLLSDSTGIQELYESIARMIGSRVPRVDFEKYGSEVARFERQYEQDRKTTYSLSGSVERGLTIDDPRVLCVTSEQFKQLGLANQIDIVLKAFPQKLQHDRIMNSAVLRSVLSTQTVDVVHIAGYVCPRTGDLFFSEVDADQGRSLSPDPDIVSADALADLLKMSRTVLVVIGSCESLVLAATLQGVTNVIGTRDLISSKTMAKWVEVFYSTLESQSLSAAFELAVKISGAAMRLYAKSDLTLHPGRTIDGAVAE